MSDETEMDLTAKLPDEILKEVFECLPSLRDKLRLESVSRRFQRCLLELLIAKPIPFNAQWEKLNGYNVSWDEMPGAIQSLAKKARFSNIDIDMRKREQTCVDRVLTALVDSETDCLSKVGIFQINDILHDGWCSQTPLKEVLAKCPKLSEVRLDFHVRPLNSEDDSSYLGLGVTSPIMDLGVVLQGRALTRLDVTLHRYTQEQVIQVFQSIQPNMLKKLSLRVSIMTLDMDKLVTELGGGAWAALEEMNITFYCCPSLRMNIILSSHFLARLPTVRRCKFEIIGLHLETQLVAALTSLFANQIEINVSFDSDPHFITWLTHEETGCQIVTSIRQVQAVYPDLQVGFGPDGDELTLTLGMVSFEKNLHAMVPSCNAENCTDCGIFYPTLITSLRVRADQRVEGIQQDVHLANGRLDRCRINTVVAHLNNGGIAKVLRKWQALHAEMNEAHNMVTITFQGDRIGQFQITIDCGHCLSNGCFGCLYVG